MPLSETNLKRKVIGFLKKHYPDAWVYKASDKWISGIPDLLICKEGRFYAIELKVGRNKATPIQEFVIRKIHEAGGRVSVCWSVEEVERFIQGGEAHDQNR